jgi:hypothetical protein
MTSKAARTCIICGERAGSGEHVFPASLGGRRVNKGIYCGEHNGALSPLAGVLAGQLRAINAFLGVVNDNTKESPAVRATDLATGREVAISSTAVEFAAPETIEEREVETGVAVTMAFSSEKQLEAWRAQKKAQGYTFKEEARSSPQRYFANEAHVSLELGGAEGLRAVGYVALTFFAHYFPELARLPELAVFKGYVQGESEGQVWWDDPVSPSANSFPFGHRILLATDHDRQVAYARVSLFSTLNFAVWFGSIPVLSPETVIVEIDPLAPHPPGDIAVSREAGAGEIVEVPADLTAALSEDILSGRGQQRFGALLQKVQEYQLAQAADRFLGVVAGASGLDSVACGAVFDEAVNDEAQRVLNLARHTIRGLATACAAFPGLPEQFHALTAAEPGSANGLTDDASRFLWLSQHVIARQMQSDQAVGALDRDRVAQLLGGGAGAHLIGVAARDIVLRK